MEVEAIRIPIEAFIMRLEAGREARILKCSEIDRFRKRILVEVRDKSRLVHFCPAEVHAVGSSLGGPEFDRVVDVDIGGDDEWIARVNALRVNTLDWHRHVALQGLLLLVVQTERCHRFDEVEVVVANERTLQIWQALCVVDDSSRR